MNTVNLQDLYYAALNRKKGTNHLNSDSERAEVAGAKRILRPLPHRVLQARPKESSRSDDDD